MVGFVFELLIIFSFFLSFFLVLFQLLYLHRFCGFELQGLFYKKKKMNCRDWKKEKGIRKEEGQSNKGHNQRKWETIQGIERGRHVAIFLIPVLSLNIRSCETQVSILCLI